MAEAVQGAQTRLKDLFEAIKKHEEVFAENDVRMEGMDQKIEKLEDILIGVGQNVKNISQNMEYLMQKVVGTDQGPSGSNREENGSGKGRNEYYTPPHMRNQNTGGQTNLQANNHTVRLKFPEFNGENPQGWIRKANRFFQIMPMGEAAKVYHSGYYMLGVADVWYMEYVEGKEGIQWEEFCQMLMSRFLRPGKEDVVIEFTKLQQTSDVNTYQEKFDELKALVKIKNPDLSEEFLTSCFLKGLKEELRVPV